MALPIQDLLFIDLESTGVDPVRDRIIELGIVTFRDGERHRWWQRFNPGVPIPAEATAIHGITDADVADCPPFAAFAGKIHRGLLDRHICGYNLRRLDLPLADEEMRRCGYKLDLSRVHVIDAFAIFAKKEPRTLSDAVRRYCGREHEGAHGATADAEATLDVLLGELAAYPDLAEMDLAALAAYARMSERQEVDLAGKLYRNADGAVCYAFGKHKDRTVADEPGYAEWILRCQDPPFPGSTRDALEAELTRIMQEGQSQT